MAVAEFGWEDFGLGVGDEHVLGRGYICIVEETAACYSMTVRDVFVCEGSGEFVTARSQPGTEGRAKVVGLRKMHQGVDCDQIALLGIETFPSTKSDSITKDQVVYGVVSNATRA